MYDANVSEVPDITMVSEKGQLVIPACMRDKLGLKPHSKLLVYNIDDTIATRNFQCLML